LTTAGGVLRTARRKQPREYLVSAPVDRIAERNIVPEEQLPFEFMLNALRLLEGFEATTFRERTGLEIAAIASELGTAYEKGLLTRTELGWRPTELGMRFLNDLQALFLILPVASDRLTSTRERPTS
jgi:oxygen-independent coproporphyrinogen-3 oxidase